MIHVFRWRPTIIVPFAAPCVEISGRLRRLTAIRRK